MLFLDLTTNWTTKAQIERQLEKRHWETGTATNGWPLRITKTGGEKPQKLPS